MRKTQDKIFEKVKDSITMEEIVNKDFEKIVKQCNKTK